MRIITASKICDIVEQLCLQANFILRPDALNGLKSAHKRETKPLAKKALDAIIANAFEAKRNKLAICQDTGLPAVFVELGQEVRVKGNLKSAIIKGVESGYKKGNLRDSIVSDPLLRGKPGFKPAIIHMDIVPGSKIKLTVLPKGFGCENKTQLKMFKPTVKIEEIKKFIVDTVRSAGADACPPYVVGVGIGGSADYAVLLAKKALLTKLQSPNSQLQAELLRGINKLNIGPMGFGGKATCLAVNIKKHPTHIAGLPVAVNISCHALRSATKTL